MSARRIMFVVYAIALVVATHWPELAIAGGGRPDLPAHAAAFGIWCALLLRTRWFGPTLSNRNIAVSTLLACAMAVLDETTQAIPAINRTFGLDDLAANGVGVVATAGIAAVLARRARNTRPAPD